MVRAKEMGTPVTIDLTKTCADSFLRGRPHAPTMGRFHIFPLPFWELSVDHTCGHWSLASLDAIEAFKSSVQLGIMKRATARGASSAS